MATSMHIINVSHNQYENVSQGNLNCIVLVQYFERIRYHIGGEQPDGSTEEWFVAQELGDSYDGYRMAMQFVNLEAETDVWIRSELNPVNVMVIRGGMTIT
jgi:hypothetical protein